MYDWTECYGNAGGENGKLVDWTSLQQIKIYNENESFLRRWYWDRPVTMANMFKG